MLLLFVGFIWPILRPFERFHCFQRIKLLYSIHYINTLKQDLGVKRAYQETDSNVMSIFNAHFIVLPVKFSVCVKEGRDKIPNYCYQGYRYHKLRKAFSKFYRRHFELISKFWAKYALT